jgi:hypothetical protein
MNLLISVCHFFQECVIYSFKYSLDLGMGRTKNTASRNSYIAVCLFVAAEMGLPHRCLEMATSFH